MKHPISPTPAGGSTAGVAVLETPTSGRAPLMAEIYVYVGQELAAKYAIEHGEYLMGRDSGCNIQIEAERQ